MITKFLLFEQKLFEYHEENMNRLLDKINKSGKNSLTQYELDLLRDEGEVTYQKHFESGHIIFDVDSTKYLGDTIQVIGTVSYFGKKYHGYFELSKEGGNDPMSLLHHFDNFEPRDDDWYNLDDLIQELESVYAN
jgi:hypothetical protein